MKKFITFLCLLLNLSCLEANLKVLHLSMHKGLITEFQGIAKELSLDVTSLFLLDMPLDGFDPALTNKNALYNVGHERAERIWNTHKAFFTSFDVILTSDTAPLARIFLQNNFKKPLIIWVCNRFDYSDNASLDCHFPDPEFYDLFRQAKDQKNVTIIGYTPFENFYAKSKGVDIGDAVIKPCAPLLPREGASSVPAAVDKKQTFFLPPRHNETLFMNLSAHLHALGIKNYCGNYNGPRDIEGFKGIIHLPYAWSNLALFENLELGLPYFVPSQKFLQKLLVSGNYWFQNSHYLSKEGGFALTEWYSKEIENVLIYFDSWEDLAYKIKTTDYKAARKKAKAFGKQHRATNMKRWKRVFRDLQRKTSSE